jgi:hypothetical protein
MALEKIIKNNKVRIKIEGKDSPFFQIPITKAHKAFFRINNLTNSVHTNQTGAFPFTSQPFTSMQITFLSNQCAAGRRRR